MAGLSRRKFLFGNIKSIVDRVQSVSIPSPLLRPPGAVEEHLFLQKCKDCSACVDACEPGVIQMVYAPLHPAHQTAYLDFTKGGCHYCNDFPCIEVCGNGALSNEDKGIGTAVIKNSCITNQHQYCELCVHACPGDIDAFIVEERGKVRIDSERCVGCGLCLSYCFLSPVAIEINN